VPYSFMLLIRSTDARRSGNVVLLGSLLDKVLYFLPEKQRLSFAQSGHINETAAPMEAERRS